MTDQSTEEGGQTHQNKKPVIEKDYPIYTRITPQFIPGIKANQGHDYIGKRSNRFIDPQTNYLYTWIYQI